LYRHSNENKKKQIGGVQQAAWAHTFPFLLEEEFEDTKGVIGNRKSKKDRQHNVSKDSYII